MIRLRVSGLEIRLWEERAGRSELLGVLSVDSGIVGLVPFANRLGGISFATVENAWKLSSSGVEFDEALLAATLQELVFGETFETRYDPLWREALEVGAQRFEPRRLGERDGYLVIELSPVDQANR
jgi:hypothetical protein